MPAALGRSIRVGTDCSGMEAPIQALHNLGVKYEHIFSCDIDKHVKDTIFANFPPKVWYPDLTQRDNKTAPKVDLYVAGFPCQPFSNCGLKQGFKDARGRGTILFDICDYIEEQQPRAFLLENVSGILSRDGGKTWAAILETLEGVANNGYHVTWGKLNTKDHGVPQFRARVYIVGQRKGLSHSKFSFTDIEPLPCPSIEDFLDARKGRPSPEALPPVSQGHARRNVKRFLKIIEKDGHDPLSKPYIIDHDGTEKFSTCKLDCSPCLTRRRGGGHWVTNRGRRFTKPEMMRLQGMKPENFKVVVSESQWGNQIGNSMSCNVLERIFVRLLPAAGLVTARRRLVDRWEKATRTACQTSAIKVKAGQKRRRGSSAASASRAKRTRGEPRGASGMASAEAC